MKMSESETIHQENRNIVRIVMKEMRRAQKLRRKLSEGEKNQSSKPLEPCPYMVYNFDPYLLCTYETDSLGFKPQRNDTSVCIGVTPIIDEIFDFDIRFKEVNGKGIVVSDFDERKAERQGARIQ
jgi:hypothetical protein